MVQYSYQLFIIMGEPSFPSQRLCLLQWLTCPFQACKPSSRITSQVTEGVPKTRGVVITTVQIYGGVSAAYITLQSSDYQFSYVTNHGRILVQFSDNFAQVSASFGFLSYGSMHRSLIPLQNHYDCLISHQCSRSDL